MLKKFSFLLVLLIIVACSEQPTAVSLPTSPPKPTHTTTPIITEADKVRLIKKAVRWGLGSLPDDNALIQDDNNVYLDTHNLTSDWIPTFDNFHIVTLPQTEIQQKVNAENRNIMYLTFTDIDFGADGKAQITISNPWLVPPGRELPLSGGAAKLEYEKIEGEWVWTVLWVAVS